VEPVVDHCGHIFCKKCIQIYLTVHQTCPHSNESLNETELTAMNFIEKILEKQTIYCKNKEKNCEWIGKYQFYDNHLKLECLKQNINCINSGCTEEFMRGDKDKHLNDCEYRLVKCEYCISSIPFITLTSHHDVCLKYPLECPLKCGLNIERENLDIHTKNECENAEVHCLYKNYGCETLIIKRNMNEHIKTEFEFHNMIVLKFMGDFYREYQEKMISLEKVYKEINERLALLKNTNLEIDDSVLKNKRIRNETETSQLEREKSEGVFRPKENKIINNSYITKIVNNTKDVEGEKNEKTSEDNAIVEDSNWNFNTQDISNGLIVEKNKVSSISSTKNIHLFAFINAQLRTDCTYKWRVNINKYSTWIAFGVCEKSRVMKNQFVFTSPNLNFNSGCFLLSSNFYSWNCNNPNENNKSVNPNKKMNSKDTILVEYNGKLSELHFSNGTFSVKLNKVKSNTLLVPCIIFLSNGDEISIDFLKRE